MAPNDVGCLKALGVHELHIALTDLMLHYTGYLRFASVPVCDFHVRKL